jgi:hypothetical protein
VEVVSLSCAAPERLDQAPILIGERDRRVLAGALLGLIRLKGCVRGQAPGAISAIEAAFRQGGISMRTFSAQAIFQPGLGSRVGGVRIDAPAVAPGRTRAAAKACGAESKKDSPVL